MDPEGKPLRLEGDNFPHYKIKLWTEGCPRGTYAVNYKLDDTYNDPNREVRSDVQNFEEEITSYGDFVVSAQIRQKGKTDLTTVLLSAALEATYGPNPSNSVAAALADIKAR